MSGNIIFSVPARIKQSNNSNSNEVLGGSDWDKGAGLTVYGKDNSTNGGGFNLFAHDGTNQKFLRGKPDGTLTWDGQPLLPVGIVQAFAGTTIPTGWLLCDGSAVSRTTYANLYAIIGTTYGAGDGSTTFNLPNLTDKFIEGSGTAGTAKTAGLPNITGHAILSGTYIGGTTLNGVFAGTSGNAQRPSGFADSNNCADMSFDASRSSAVYGNSTTVQPPALTMKYIIKY